MPRFTMTPWIYSLLLGGLSACSQPQLQPHAQTQQELQLTLTPWQPSQAQQAEYWHILSQHERLGVNKQGLWLFDRTGAQLAHMAGNFATLDVRQQPNGLIIATSQQPSHQPLVLQSSRQLQELRRLTLPPSPYPIEDSCLYQDDQQHLFLLTLGEEGQGDQWLVATPTGLLKQAQHVRRLQLPPNSEHCAVDDAQHRLYISEEGVGIWAYDAHPEADTGRVPVDMRKPFGSLEEMASGLAAVPGGLLALDADAGQLHRYVQQGADRWEALAPVAVPKLEEPERLALNYHQPDELLIVDGDSKSSFITPFAWPIRPQAVTPIPAVQATVQTTPVPHAGDAADDPAIWRHPSAPERSLVLGTDKRGGLGVYDLNGQQKQYLAVGRLNNVDVRYGFTLGQRTVDLAVASHRDHNSLQVFTIDSNGTVQALARIATPLTDIYGLCMGTSRSGALYAIANDQDGRFVQYRLSAQQGKLEAKLVREFAVASQPEGCVMDDQRQRLFIGEEDQAMWTLAADENASTEMTQVMAVGEVLHADIEGLALYQHPKHPYLIISSQGNNSYVVLDATPPFALRGRFQISLNSQLGIDGVSETDGLEVSSANFGGAWQQGILVVQDGRKRMPEANQNFKYVPWQSVARVLNLE